MLSPYLFSVYIDSVVQRVHASGTGCYVKFTCVTILLYVDDILLLAPSVTALQQLLHACETELTCLDMAINCSQHNVNCVNIRTVAAAKYCGAIKLNTWEST